MKKSLIALVLLAPLFSFGAVTGVVKVAQELKSWDFFAQITAPDKSPIFIYKIKDEDKTCYVASQRNTYMAVNQTPVDALSISCVK